MNPDIIYLIGQFRRLTLSIDDDLVRIFFDDDIVIIEKQKLNKIIKSYKRLNHMT